MAAFRLIKREFSAASVWMPTLVAKGERRTGKAVSQKTATVFVHISAMKIVCPEIPADNQPERRHPKTEESGIFRRTPNSCPECGDIFDDNDKQ